MYDEALKAMMLDMASAERDRRFTKDGLIGFPAFQCAMALERDGLREGIQTKVVATYATTMTPQAQMFCVRGISKKEVK